VSSTIAIEGGLFDPDLLERLTTAPDAVEGQKPEDFGLERRVRLAEEIQEAFGRVLSHWRSFERRRLAAGEGAIGRIAREGWVLPLLRELGFEPRFRRQALRAGDGTFPISHVEGPISHGEGEEETPLVPIHLAPFEQDLDSRGEGRRSPHGLLQDCLDRTDLLWGIVSNGRRLRLLRANARTTRQAFLEVDLEAIARDELYPDFALLFRLLHRSRFPKSPGAAHECLLERWYQKAIEEGGRVREKLREGVERALDVLGSGFLAHPESDKLHAALAEGRLSPEAFRDQLLALVYRLLFLLTAEERRLLARPDEESARRYAIYERWYGISRLRERAERRRPDPWADLWIGLTVLFRALDEPEEAPKLGLCALDGDLFAAASCLDLEEARIANDRLLEALFHLSTFEPEEGRGRRARRGPRRRVRFSALDVRGAGLGLRIAPRAPPRGRGRPAALRLRRGPGAQDHRQLLHARSARARARRKRPRPRARGPPREREDRGRAGAGDPFAQGDRPGRGLRSLPLGRGPKARPGARARAHGRERAATRRPA